MLRWLWIIGLILVIVWLLGFIITPFMGSFIHVLLAIGIILLIIWLVTLIKSKR